MSHMFQIVTCYNIFLVSGAAVQKPGSLPGTFNYPSYVQHIMGWVDSLPFQTHMTTVVKAVETRTSFFLCVVLFNGTTMGQGVAWKLCVGYYWVKDFQTILSFTCIVALCVWRTGNEPSSLASFPGSPHFGMQTWKLWGVYIFLFRSASGRAWERGYEFSPYVYPVYYTLCINFASISAVTYFLLDLDHSGVCVLYVAVSLIPRPFNVVWEWG